MKFILAPWRWDFISKISKLQGCLFCKALKQKPEDSLICYRGQNYFIILNKYPYNTGHLMIVPYDHLSSPEDISPEKTVEMWSLLNRSLKILQKNFNPHGFNVGMNIGKAAGAGVKDHFHLHVVPRWTGDSNFMSIIGNSKVISYKPENILDILKKEFDQCPE
jgi:ATP adenylyltransferase